MDCYQSCTAKRIFRLQTNFCHFNFIKSCWENYCTQIFIVCFATNRSVCINLQVQLLLLWLLSRIMYGIDDYHTCLQLSLNVHRIRYRPTQSIRVWLSGLRLYLQSDRDKTLHTLGSLSLSTGLTLSHNRAELCVAAAVTVTTVRSCMYSYYYGPRHSSFTK